MLNPLFRTIEESIHCKNRVTNRLGRPAVGQGVWGRRRDPRRRIPLQWLLCMHLGAIPTRGSAASHVDVEGRKKKNLKKNSVATY